MEADWSLALGPGDPWIAVPWQADGERAATCRYVPLRTDADRVDEVAETQTNPALRNALLRLNGTASHLWTVKCDAWTTGPETGDPPFDPYEMDAEPGTTAFGAGSYIDLLVRDEALFLLFADQEQWMHAVVDTLRAIPAGNARVELVMRPARVDETAGFGFTCFVEGCGPTTDSAGRRWAEALALALAVLIDTPCETALRNDTMAETGE